MNHQTNLHMKKISLLILALILTQASIGQLTGIKTIPGDYATISAAVTALNSAGIGTGGVTFNVAAGYTESITTPILVTATGTSANPIVFRKNGTGNSPKITRTDAGSVSTSAIGAQGDAVIIIQGSDYITFDRISVAANSQGIEYGYYLRKASATDGCKYVTIKNCAITLTKGTSAYVVGICSSNNTSGSSASSNTGVTVTSTGGINEYVTITGDTISNVMSGIYARGYDAGSPYTLYDQNLVIGTAGAGNVIRNFAGGTTATSSGIYFINHQNPTISYNTIDNAAGGGSAATGLLYGIYISTTYDVGDFVASNNTIILSQGSASAVLSISNAQPCNSMTISNNTFGFGAFASSADSYILYINSNTNDMTISGNQTTGAITKTVAGDFYCLFNRGNPTGGTISISDNNFSHITLTGASLFFGIDLATSTTQLQQVNNNTFTAITGGSSEIRVIDQGYGASGSTVNGNVISNISGTAYVNGVYIGDGAGCASLTVQGNTISGLTTGSRTYGIFNDIGGTTTNICQNRIYDLTSTNTGSDCMAEGIHGYSSGTTNVYIYNNFISDLTAPSASYASDACVIGIYTASPSGAFGHLFYNTVYLDGTSTGTNFSTAAMYASTGSKLDLRNNIFVNMAIPKGSGSTMAYYRTSTTISTFQATSNNNLYYAGTPSAANLIFSDGTHDDQTLAAYQARMGSTKDADAVTELPPFVNVASTPYDLHLFANTTQCESGGVAVSSPIAVNTDFDGDPRYPNAGYPNSLDNSATAPDIGADEFAAGPLSGTQTIPGNFPSIAAAVSALNFHGAGASGVTFNIAPGYTESITTPIILTATGTPSGPILFQKSGSGANPVVTRTDAGSLATSVLGGQGDAVIIIQGSDYVTFNGIDVAAGDQGIEYGYYLRKAGPTDGCKNVTITNCAVTMTKGTSCYVAGIYASNNNATSPGSSNAGITLTSTGGRHENVTLTGNTIGNVFTGILLIGYNHPYSPYNFYDQNFVVGTAGAGNVIQNFGGNSTNSAYGVYLLFHTSPAISYNTISNTAGGGNDANCALYGIYMHTSYAGGNFAANNNAITLGQASTLPATSIYNGQTCSAVTINNNTFSYGTFASTDDSYCIRLGGNTNNITATGNQTNGTINKTGYGYFYGFYFFGTPTGGTANISNNTFSTITIKGWSSFTGISHSATTSQTELINNNTISQISEETLGGFYGIVQSGGAAGSAVSGNNISNITGGTLTGISLGNGIGPAAITAANNVISGLSSNFVTSVTGISSFNGINTTISKNTIFNLAGNSPDSKVYGIATYSGFAALHNNFISDLRNPSSTSLGVTGIYLSSGTTNNVFFNTIYLSGTSYGTNFGSAAIIAESSAADLRNNILVNLAIPTGTGKTVAFQRTTADLTNYAATSNNNLLYAGTPSSGKLVYFDGTNSDQTLAVFQSRVGPARDAASVTELPPFVNVAAKPYDLHLKTNVTTQCESGGTVVSSPVAITTDFDGDARYPNAGYPQNAGFTASAPDIGADEFGGISQTALVFNVTGGGAYCSGGTGNTVGLSGSQTDASYQLFKDAVAYGSPVAGIGSALSWTALPAGTWTIQATYFGNGTWMSGNAIITMLTALTAGTATGTQTICYNTAPSTLSCTNAYGGSGPYACQWQVNSSGWTAVSGATTRSYTPGALTATTQYRLQFTDAGTPSCGQVTSNTVTITVNSNVTAGISGGTSPICYNTAPGTLTATGSGGTNSYTFQWYTTGGIISGATNATYAPGNLTATTGYYCAVTGGSCAPVNTTTTTITVYGNMAGIKTIPGDFTTIAGATAMLNNCGVGAGGVIFNVAAGYTENITTPIILTATGTSANPIVFQKSGSGPNPVVTRTDAGGNTTSILGGQGDGVIIIQGSDYVTFNGIDVATGNEGIEYGYYLRKASATDGCKNVTITNCAVTMTKGASAFVAGIYASNNDATSLVSSSAGITLTSTGGRHENVTLTGNTISNVFTGILLIGYNHTSSPYSFNDQNFVVGTTGAGNVIQNFAGNAASPAYGVYLVYHTSPTISYNAISNTAGGGSDATGLLYGIYMHTSSAGGDFVANNNAITLGQSSTAEATAIYNLQTCTSVTINNNTLTYGSLGSISSSLIRLSGNTNNITVTGNQTTGTITKTGVGSFTCVIFSGSPTGGTANISNNTFSNITLTGASPFQGISFYTSPSQTELINNNTISQISGGTSSVYGIVQGGGAAGSTVNGNSITNISSNGTIYGIYLGLYAGAEAITSAYNIISGLSSAGAGTINGIYNFSGTANTLSHNTIYDLAGNNVGSSVYGIAVRGGTTNYLDNNFISDLRLIDWSTSVLAGILINGGVTNHVFLNTIYLDDAITGAEAWDAAIWVMSSVVDLRDNILVNMIHSIGSIIGVVIRWPSTNLTNYAATSNNNLFYAGTPYLGHSIYSDGINFDETLAAFQSRVGPTRDAASVTELPPFVNVTTKPYNLHLKTDVATQCESGGTVVSTPVAITTDFDGDARYPNSGYPDNISSPADAPDIGADEFGGLAYKTRVFNVTGGGTDCSGGAGMTVELSGSQSGAYYQLFKDAVGYRSQRTGTGSALSWTSLPAGTYTIQATYAAPAWMNGNAVITTQTAFIAGTASATQTLCYNTVPSPLSCTDATGGGGPYTYQWQVNSGGWTSVTGATTRSYAPGALTATTQYRLQFTDAGTPSCGQINSNTVTITVNSTLTSGISGGTSPICYNTSPGTLTATGSGGTNSYTFQWYTTAAIINGATNATYAPGNLTASTGYFCAVTSGSCGTVNTTTLPVTVYDNFSAGSIVTTGEIIEYNGNPGVIGNITAAGGGDGTITYRWQSSTDDGFTTPTIISNNATTYDPPAGLTVTTLYRRQATDGSCSAGWISTAATMIAINVPITPGTIGSDQSVCSGTAPAFLTSVTGGTGPGTISYQWQTNAGGSYATIGGASVSTYQPPALTATTSYQRRAVFTNSGNVSYSDYSEPVVITVISIPVLNGGPTASPASICPNGYSLLTAYSPDNNINWYTLASGGTALGSSASGSYFHVYPASATTYYAEAATPSTLSYNQEFSFTGTPQTFTVPPGTTFVTITAFGAAGTGIGAMPGNGGMAAGTLDVTPGQDLILFVGGQGSPPFNGGGFSSGGGYGYGYGGANGGDASDVRVGGTGLYNRVIVAGGGGGVGSVNYAPWDWYQGRGDGGGGIPVGYNFVGGGGGGGYGAGGEPGYAYGGGGGISASGGGGGGGGLYSGGSGGQAPSYGGAEPGSFGAGGNAMFSPVMAGGGGGGYFGGGAGLAVEGGAQGGGGSSWTGTLSNPNFAPGVNPGPGYIMISWQVPVIHCVSPSRSAVSVTLNTAITITAQSTQSQTRCLNNPFNAISVTASGTAPLTYRWYKNPVASLSGGTLISGATSASYTPLATSAGTLYYYCTVYGSCSPNATSDISGAFIVNDPPGITGQPVSPPTVAAGTNSSTFTVTASGAGLTYQWQRGIAGVYTPITGATTPDDGCTYSSYNTATLTVTNAPAGMNGYTYQCVVSGTCSPVATSDGSATLTFYSALTAGISGGTSPVCYNTAPGTLTAMGSGGTGSYTFQWYTTAAIISGATNATYAPGNLTATTGYYCAVTSSPVGTVNTSTTTITVYGNITATLTGGTSPVCYNTSPGTLTATGSGSIGSYTFQWHTTSGIISGATDATYAPGNLTASTGYYCAVKSGSCGPKNTPTTYIGVYDNVSAGSIQTTGETIGSNGDPGVIGNITAASGGDGIITYRWQSSTNAGFTSPTNISSNAAMYDPPAGLTATTMYRRQAMDGSCSADWVSTAATMITVNVPITPGTIGSDQSVCSGSTPALLVSVTGGTGPGLITYEWQTNAGGSYVTIGGATASTYQAPALTATASYQRRTVITNNSNVSYSDYTEAVVITVISIPVLTGGPTASPASICPNGYSLLTAYSPDNNINWYTLASGGTALGSSASGEYFGVTSASATTYYAEAATPSTLSYSQEFSFTGTPQTFTVPPGITSVTITAFGAAGTGIGAMAGNGGMAQGTLDVTPGQDLFIFVGGQGSTHFNGGGFCYGGGYSGANGGDASDVRVGGMDLYSRVIVAGGGGGAGSVNYVPWNCFQSRGDGGGGIQTASNFVGGGGGGGYDACGAPGQFTGGAGGSGANGGGGGGGGLYSGGYGGEALSFGMGEPGSFGKGGDVMFSPVIAGGGGGGYFGGGAGFALQGGAQGGGGSSWTGNLSSPSFAPGVNPGPGYINITWTKSLTSCASPSRSAVSVTINPATIITAQSTQSQTRCLNGTFNAISVTASGTAPLTYRWYKNPVASASGGTLISGATSASYTPPATSAGTLYYSCIVHGNCGPNATSDISGAFVVNELPVITGQPVSPPAVAPGTNSSTFTVTASGTGLTYQWQRGISGIYTPISGATTPDDGCTYINYNAATLTVTNAPSGMNGYTYQCVVSGTCSPPATSDGFATLSVYSELTAAISGGTSPICINTAPGTFTATGSGGTGSYTFQWYTTAAIISGATNATYAPGNLTATTGYYCAVTSNSVGTVNTTTRTITVYGNLTASLTGGTSPVCYNTSPGTLTATCSGGTGSYTFQWHTTSGAINGATDATYAPGNLTVSKGYYCEVTSGSCGTANTSTTTIAVLDNFTAGNISTTGQSIPAGSDPGVIPGITAAGGGDGTITYKWQSSADDGFSSPTDIVNNASSYDPPPGLTASTWYRRMAKDGTCAGWTASTGTWQVTVISNLSPGAILTTGETVCMNGNPGVIGNAVNASGGTAPITYKWQSSANAGFSSPADIVNNATSYDPPSGLTVTTWYRRLAKDAGINSDWVISSGVWQVAVLSQLVAGSVSPNQNVCTNGLPALITAAGPNGGSIPYTGQWQCSSDNVNFTDITGVTGTGYQAGALSQTRYYRQVQTSTLGCGTVSTASVTVTVAPNQITASATLNPVCPGAATTIFASGGYGYSWDQGQGPGSSKVVSPVTATSYKVTGTSNNGCAGGFATIIVNVTSLPVVVINGSAYGSTPASSTIAPGASENLTASGAASFVWNNGTTSNPLTVSPTATTTYSVTGTTDGCSATASHTVIVSGVSVGPNQTICPGTSATLTAYSNGIPSPSYLWTPGNLTGATVIVTPASTTIYTVTVNGSLTSSVTVTVRPKPVVNAGPDVSIAAASTVSLNASVTFLTVAPYAYAWSTTGGSIVSGGATPTLTVGAAGTYSVMVTDANGCISSPDEAVVTLITSGYTVSGNVAYAFNTVNSQMHGVTLSLKQAGTVVYTTTTPPTGNGNYQFNGVASGSYTVCLSSSKPWGGVSSADILLIQNHYKTPPTLLTGIKRLAADVVDNSSQAIVNVTDRDLINNRRLTPTGYSFLTGDWVFTRAADISINSYPAEGIMYANALGSSITLTVSGSNVNQDFRALCYGDVDASNTGTKDNENTVVNFNTSNGFDLSNFPNPFTGQTTFRYTIPVEGTVTVTVHTMLGVTVATLDDPDDYAGIHTMVFRNNGLAPGVYLYTVKLVTSDDVIVQTGKMVIVQPR